MVVVTGWVLVVELNLLGIMVDGEFFLCYDQIHFLIEIVRR